MGPFETVEDQAEAELVLVAVVVTGLQNMPECELGEVGVLVSGEARKHDLRERRALLWSVERQPPLLQTLTVSGWATWPRPGSGSYVTLRCTSTATRRTWRASDWVRRRVSGWQ
jgi:hypothetical protein